MDPRQLAVAVELGPDQHLAALGGRTVEQALAEGEDTRDVWRAVCAHTKVPSDLT